MALINFELTEDHLKLLKFLDWEINKKNNSITAITEHETPYGGLNIIEDAGLILYGKPDSEFDPLSPDGPQYSEEQTLKIKQLYSELPMALEIVLFLQTFETGMYKRKWNLKNWKKI